MKYKCCRVFHFYFCRYIATTYQRYEEENAEHEKEKKKKIRKKEVQEKGQNTHYIMHTQYLARKNH